jgi:hypothetical protein
MSDIKFVTPTGTIFTFSEDELGSYPDSFLSISALGSFRGDCENGSIRVSFSDEAMEQISYFYKNGIWKCPYLVENQWKIQDVGTDSCSILDSFEDYCEFLGLDCTFEDSITSKTRLEELEAELDTMDLLDNSYKELERQYYVELHYEEEARSIREWEDHIIYG